MNTAVKTKSEIAPQEILQKILEEIRLLRGEVSTLLPQDDLDNYANPSRIRNSYSEAIKKYPPVAL